jgi:hypothetical protein
LYSGSIDFLFGGQSGAKLTVSCRQGQLKISKIALFGRIYSQGGKVGPELRSPTFDMFIDEMNEKPKHDGRFLIFCTSRSGSTMLSSALSTHPNVLFHGESFGLQKYPLEVLGIEKDTREGVAMSQVLRDIRETDSIYFLNSVIWNEQLLKTHSIGFKIKSEETEEFRREVFEWILERKEIKVICIHRESFWDRFISVIATIQEGRFNTSDRSHSHSYIELSPKEILFSLRDALSKQAVYEMQSSMLQKDRKIITVTYEEMIFNWSHTVKRVENFLGLEDIDIEPFTSKLPKSEQTFSQEVLNLLDNELRETKYYKEYIDWRSKITT